MNTNLSVRDVVRFHVVQCGSKIHEIKAGNKMRVVGEDSVELMIGRPISPASPSWNVYQGYKRECSMWLTAIKILKTDPDFHDRPMERSTAQDHASQICHLTRAQRRTSKITSRCLASIKGRLKRIQEQLVNGSRITTTRTVYVKPEKPTGMHVWKQEESIVYTPKSFEAIAQWKAAHEARIEEAKKAVEVGGA